MSNVADAFQIGLEYHRAGRLPEAERSFRSVLEFEPAHAEATHCLGVVALRSGRADEAIQLLSSAIDLEPDRADFRTRLGEALQATGRLDEAVECYRCALKVAHDDVESLVALGQILYQQGKLNKAKSLFETASRISPDSIFARSSLGLIKQAEGQIDEAVRHFRHVTQIAPLVAEGHFLLAEAIADDRPEEALECYQRALSHNPSLLAARVSLARLLRLLEQDDEAIAECGRALQVDPRSAAAYAELGAALMNRADVPNAIAAYHAAVELAPQVSAYHSGLLFALNFDPNYNAPTVLAEHKTWAARHADPLTAQSPPHANDRAADRLLRIGYLSSHFRQHSIGAFLEPVIEAHDRRMFQVHCYHDRTRDDATTARYKAAADVWRDVAAHSPQAIAEIIRADQIDILVDVDGHLGGDLILAAARRPAPVQVSYLGYPNTTGMRAVDYRLSDAQADPPGASDANYVEQVVRLPGAFFCYRPLTTAPSINALPAQSSGHITFGSFNHPQKLSAPTIAAWGRILAAVPDARLVVLGAAGGQFEAQLRDALAQQKVDPVRVEIVSRRPHFEYLQLFQHVDIALDPLGFNGHTTVCDALWMGVPSIMHEGAHYGARFGTSVMTNLGLTELVARSTDDYIAKAVSLAGDRDRLAKLRASLRERMQTSALLDVKGFTRALEAAYRQMWHSWCQRG